MASFPVRWWRAILSLIQLKHDAAHDGWVTPSNEITRAILSGREILLGAPLPAPVAAATAEMATPFVPAAPMPVEEAATSPVPAEVAVEVAAPAAEKPARHAGRAA